MIQFVNVDYEFGSKAFSLRDISLSVEAGERVCLLGANGSGKSTLLRLAAGILKPQAGEVVVDGIPTRSEREFGARRGQLGFIFQNPDDQILTASVRSELAFTLENLNIEMSGIESRSALMAKRFRLESLLDRHPESLSAGEKQRLVLAATLISSPQILILDEPSSYLDKSGRELIHETIFGSREWCVLAATQHLAELVQYDRVIFLEGGAVTFEGSVERFRASETYHAISAGRVKNDKRVAVRASGGEALKAQGISFGYSPTQRCLEEVDLEIPGGSICGITGESGCGKSTLAMLLVGLMNPEAGEIWIGGARCTAEERLQKVGMVFQIPETAIFAESVFEEIAFGLRNQHVTPELLNSRVEQALHLVGLEASEFLDRNPFTLSAGEKRLVAIASTIALNRPVVIFDESTAGLDWNGVDRIGELMLKLRAEGRMQIVISHDRDFLEQVADQMITLDANE